MASKGLAAIFPSDYFMNKTELFQILIARNGSAKISSFLQNDSVKEKVKTFQILLASNTCLEKRNALYFKQLFKVYKISIKEELAGKNNKQFRTKI